MLTDRAGFASANECQLLGTRAELREESGVGPLADASAGDKVLVIYCFVFSVFWLPWAHLPRTPQGKPTLQAVSPAAHPHGAACGFWGWQVLPGPAIWASVFLLHLSTISEPCNLPQV